MGDLEDDKNVVVGLRKPLRVALAMHEALRRLRVPADQIFISNHRGKITILTQGYERNVGFALGDAWEGWEADWISAVAWWNDPTTSPRARNAVYAEETFDRARVVTELVLAGIYTAEPAHKGDIDA